MLPRAAADTRGHYSALRYAGASIVRYAMRARAAEGGVGEEERRRDDGTGNRAKEVAGPWCLKC